MVEEAIGNMGAVPREVSADAGYYSARRSGNSAGWEWTPSLQRRRPATVRDRNRRPGAGYPKACRPGTG